ncbi:thioredoxin family protein [Candidatus Neomarinimicrobiota bacterium]
MQITITDENFKREVLDSDLPVIVECSANWSGTSEIIKPVIYKILLKYENQVKFGILDIDIEKNTILQYGIKNAPAVLLFNKGQLQEYLSGVFSFRDLEFLISQYIKNE